MPSITVSVDGSQATVMVGVEATSTWRGFSAMAPMPVGIVPYSAASPFHERVPANPKVLPNSTAMVLFTLGKEVENLNTDGGFSPIYYASTMDPVVELRVEGPGSQLSGHKIHCPVKAVPAPGSDAHMCIVQPNGEAFDLWQASPHVGAGFVSASGAGISNLDTGSGICDIGGACAANFGLVAGLIRSQELIAGTIPHALVATVSETRNGFVPPANHTDGTSSDINAPYEGQRFYLEYTDAEIAALKLLAWKAAIATAIAHYGLYVCDSGGDGIGIKLESTCMYTALGAPDPLTTFARTNSLPIWEGKYIFHLNEGIDWTRLRAIAPH